MKSKKLWMFISLIFVFSLVFGLTGCGGNGGGGKPTATLDYTIEFVVNDQVYHKEDKYSNMDSINLPTNPTRQGYSFDGWFLDRYSLTEQFDGTNLPENVENGKLKVWAKWSEVLISNIYLDQDNITMIEGTTSELNVSVYPSNALNKYFIWTSSDEEVVTVNNGIIQAINEGVATITVKTFDGKISDTCTVTVNPVVNVENITLDKSDLTINTGDSDTLNVSFMPVNASFKEVEWSSSNPSVVTVNNGKITGVSGGTATITAKAIRDNKTAQCVVTVLDVGDFDFVPYGNGYALAGYYGTDTNVTVPEKYNGKPVVAIGVSGSTTNPGGFYKCSNIISISLPTTINEISSGAFAYCTSLENLSIPNCKIIGSYAFQDCSSLNSITLPEDCQTISSAVFYRCNRLKNVTINGGDINSSIFLGNTTIEDLTIGDKVTKIDNGSFTNCTSLKSLTIPYIQSNFGDLFGSVMVSASVKDNCDCESYIGREYNYGGTHYIFQVPNGSIWYANERWFTYGNRDVMYQMEPIEVSSWSNYEIYATLYGSKITLDTYKAPSYARMKCYYIPRSLSLLTITNQAISKRSPYFNNCPFEIDILKKLPISKIELNGNTEVFIDEFDFSNYSFTVTRSDDTKETVKSFKDYISETDQELLKTLGTHSVTITYENFESVVNFVVKNHSFDNAVFNSDTVVYDGNAKSIFVTNIPEGTDVVYENNGQTENGEYTVKATLSKDNYDTKVLTAKLTIEKATYDMSKVVFNNKTVTYNKEVQSLDVENLPEGVYVTYENNNKIDAGTYNVVAKFSSSNPNYNEIADKRATLTIEQLELQVRFEGSTTVKYTGEVQKTISVYATNVIDGDDLEIDLDYSGAMVNAGTYTVTASIWHKNYKLTTNNTTRVRITREVHTITFRQEGQKDKVLSVYDLASCNKPAYIPVEGYTIEWEDVDLSCVTEDKVVNAILTPNEYTISFVSNGGSETDSITQNYKTTVIEPQKPVWEGKSFAGWYTDSNFSTAYEFTTMPAQNLTLYAKWVSYSLTLNYTEKYAIKADDELVPAFFDASASDTDGRSLEVKLTILAGQQVAGEKISIRLEANGLYSKNAFKSFIDIKVYDTPTINYDSTKDYILISDKLNPKLFNLSGVNSFGEATTCNVSVLEGDYDAGDIITIILTSEDPAGNVAQVEIPNIKVYGKPNIDTGVEKIKAYNTNELTLDMINVSATDNFGESVDLELVSWEVNYSGLSTGYVDGSFSKYIKFGESLTFKAFATEKYSLVCTGPQSATHGTQTDWVKCHDVYGYIYVYDVATNTQIKSFTIQEGKNTTFTIDVVAGQEYRVTTSVRCNKSSTTLYDSHYGELRVVSETHTADTSIFAISDFVGKYIYINLKATDKYGNETQVRRPFYVCSTPKIYSGKTKDFREDDEITLEKLGVFATDSTGTRLTDVKLELIEGTQTAGSVLKYRVTATDFVGNRGTLIISGIKIYGAPTIEYSCEGLKNTGNPAIDKTSYTVSFDLNGGSGTVKSQVINTEVGLVYPNIPVKSNCIFTGWYTDKECTNPFDFTATVTKDYKLYAGWFSRPTDLLNPTTFNPYLSDQQAKNVVNNKIIGNFDVIFASLENKTYKITGTATMMSGLLANDSYSNHGVIFTLINARTSEVISSYVDYPNKSTTGFNFDANIGDVFIITARYEKNRNDTNMTVSMKQIDKPVAGGKTERPIVETGAQNYLNATATDSFGNELQVFATLKSGIFGAGNTVVYTLMAEDHLGNVIEIDTVPIKVYSVNDLNLTYNAYITDSISINSKGEEFLANTSDSFDEKADVSIEIVDGIFEPGQVVSLKLVATDKAGNTKESDIISNIKVYGDPTITFNRNESIIHETADNWILLFTAVDSFGDELECDVEIIDGERIAGQQITVKVTASDDLGNKAERIIVLDVIED